MLNFTYYRFFSDALQKLFGKRAKRIALTDEPSELEAQELEELLGVYLKQLGITRPVSLARIQ
jgi:hypothetical protein